jgi:hypothetical protein
MLQPVAHQPHSDGQTALLQPSQPLDHLDEAGCTSLLPWGGGGGVCLRRPAAPPRHDTDRGFPTDTNPWPSFCGGHPTMTSTGPVAHPMRRHFLRPLPTALHARPQLRPARPSGFDPTVLFPNALGWPKAMAGL